MNILFYFFVKYPTASLIKLYIFDINDISLLYKFLNIIRFIEFFYVAIQKLLIKYFIKRIEKTIIMKKLLKNYQNYVKLIRILIELKKISHSIFAILQSESSDSKIQKNEKNEKKSNKKCLYNEKHSLFKCFYLISIICLFD